MGILKLVNFIEVLLQLIDGLRILNPLVFSIEDNFINVFLAEANRIVDVLLGVKVPLKWLRLELSKNWTWVKNDGLALVR